MSVFETEEKTRDGWPIVVLVEERDWSPYRNCFEMPEGSKCWIAIALPLKTLGYGSQKQDAIDMAISRSRIEDQRKLWE